MNKKAAFDAWLTTIEMEKSGAIATILKTDQTQGKRNSESLFISKDHSFVGSLGDAYLEEQVIQLAKQKLAEKNPSSETRIFQLLNKQEVAVFVDVFVPQPKILIFGAGHDAIPVANFIASSGFKTTIVDQRPLYITEERFPDIERIIARADDFKGKVIIDDNTYVIVMNHHLERDQEALTFALNSQAPYIGVLGPRSRRNRIINNIKASGSAVTESQMSRLYNPIGLDIGARTPEEIAISIAAEIIAIKNGYSGGFLKDSEFIHHASAVSEENG
ncbi:XdhC family protein [Oceanobacillus chungangensis]|uniref:XdhC Rossmann domain-containing protein n=1 Tax=Oceanobacillus chungangensis TaxID=1229152 RepID=A0A3D8PJI8_9BACI|nr:XdhC family protein [Oceanobacillus chungangensis]RDW15388.1 hypothetical protein CWR45_16505 [Oceanobacillus chungangensis]